VYCIKVNGEFCFRASHLYFTEESSSETVVAVEHAMLSRHPAIAPDHLTKMDERCLLRPSVPHFRPEYRYSDLHQRSKVDHPHHWKGMPPIRYPPRVHPGHEIRADVRRVMQSDNKTHVYDSLRCPVPLGNKRQVERYRFLPHERQHQPDMLPPPSYSRETLPQRRYALPHDIIHRQSAAPQRFDAEQDSAIGNPERRVFPAGVGMHEMDFHNRVRVHHHPMSPHPKVAPQHRVPSHHFSSPTGHDVSPPITPRYAT